MSTFNAPLTSPQYSKLRSYPGFASQQNVSLFSNRVVFAAQLGQDLSITVSFAAFAYGSVSVGAYTDVQIGQTFLMGTENDIQKATFRGRVRLAPDGATFYCNESSAKFAPGAYFWCIDTFEPWDRLSRPVGDPPSQRVDYDQTYLPLAPSILGLQYIYVGDVSVATGKLRVTLALTGVAMEAGQSIASWLIVPRAGTYTLISGSLSSANAVIDFNPGETWFAVTVTDSAGTTLTRNSGVKAHNAANPPDVSVDKIEVSGDIDRGWTARLPFFDGVDSVLPWTLGVVWRSYEMYGGVETTLGTLQNLIDFIGFFREDSPNLTTSAEYSILSETTFSMVDIANRMQSIEFQGIPTFNDSTSEWDHITTLTPRRALWHALTRHSTVANLVDVGFDASLTDDRYEFPVIPIEAGNLLKVLNDVAAQVNAALEFANDGRIYIPRDLRYLDATARAAAPVIAGMEAAQGDFIVVGGNRVYEDNIGILDGNGGLYTPPSTVQVTQVRAPGTAQGLSQGRDNLSNQILEGPTDLNSSQTEIDQRAGDAYEIKNFTETVTIEFPGGWTFLIPSRAQWYTLVISAADFPDLVGVMRYDYDADIRWLLESVSFNHVNEQGTRRNTATLRRESRIGDPAYTILIPVQPYTPPTPFPTVPTAFPALNPSLTPPGGITVPPPAPKPNPVTTTTPKDGNLAITWTEDQAWITSNYISLASPIWFEITPPTLGAFKIEMAIFDLLTIGTSTPDAYLLAYDSGDDVSAVWHTTSAVGKPPVWVKGTEIDGHYTLIRLTSTAGRVAIYAPDAGGGAPSSGTIHIAPGDWDLLWGAPGGGDVVGVETSGAWNPNTRSTFVTASFRLPVSGATITAISVSWRCDNPGASVFQPSLEVFLFDEFNTVLSFSASYASLEAYVTNRTYYQFGFTSSAINNTVVSNYTPNQLGETIWVQIANGSNGDYPGTPKIVGDVTISYTGGTAVVGPKVAMSNDYGGSFASPVNVGDAVTGEGGFDVQHTGTVQIAAADLTARRATSFGGSFSDASGGDTPLSHPILILIPWCQWGSATVKNTGTTPHYLLGAAAPDGGESLWLCDGIGGRTDITPTAGALAIGPNCATTWNGTRIAILVDVSGTTHLYTGVISAGPTVVWTDQGAIDTEYIRGVYFQNLPKRLLLAGVDMEYSPDFGATLYPRTPPIASGILGIEPGG